MGVCSSKQKEQAAEQVASSKPVAQPVADVKAKVEDVADVKAKVEEGRKTLEESTAETEALWKKHRAEVDQHGKKVRALAHSHTHTHAHKRNAKSACCTYTHTHTRPHTRTQMRECFDAASKAHDEGKGAEAKALSLEGKKEQAAMHAAQKKAAEAIFAAKNLDQPEGTIDLHGLQVAEAVHIVEAQVTAHGSAGDRRGPFLMT